MTRIGVLALQGDFVEHEAHLARLGVETRRIRLPRDLEGLDGLIIPGGESTTIGKLAVDYGLVEPLVTFSRSGRPMWGTCAGLIFMARDIGNEREQPLLRVMDIVVRRNAFGRQVDSFETEIDGPALYALDNTQNRQPFHAVFIRAPVISAVGPEVEVLARLPDGRIVAARQGHLLVTAFHPELTDDDRFHRYFLSLASS